ncbi:hypothetical protein C2E23DRAFT_891066 [Lenzites betulinus]|nr:hypothetical protein C2E23DRAFT_891066 [Lenzites betulinus]
MPMGELPIEERSSLRRLEDRAESEIKETSDMLTEITLPREAAKSRKVTKKFVEGGNNVLDYLEIMTELHPIAAIVMCSLTKVISLERQRQENDARIAAIPLEVKTFYYMRLLAYVENDFDEEFGVRLNAITMHMASTIHEFGTFVETYFQKRKYTVIFPHLHKKRLKDFRRRFQQHREELEELSKKVVDKRRTSVGNNTEEILRMLPAPIPNGEKVDVLPLCESSDAGVVEIDSTLVTHAAVTPHEETAFGTKEPSRHQDWDNLTSFIASTKGHQIDIFYAARQCPVGSK